MEAHQQIPKRKQNEKTMIKSKIAKETIKTFSLTRNKKPLMKLSDFFPRKQMLFIKTK